MASNTSEQEGIVFMSADPAPAVREFFDDIRVGIAQNASSRTFVQMTLRGGFQRFVCDIRENRRGLRQCERIARALGLPFFITDEARAAMQAHE